MRKILEGDRGAVHIACIGGSCPVQAEGTVDGKPFYFRARHKHWYMGIGGDPMTEPAWFRRTQWGTGEFAAGYMPEDEARRLIEQCAADYSAGTLRLPKFP